MILVHTKNAQLCFELKRYHLLRKLKYSMGCAVRENNLGIVKYFYSIGQTADKFDFMWATEVEMFKFLYYKGLRVDKHTLERACFDGHLEIVKFLY